MRILTILIVWVILGASSCSSTDTRYDLETVGHQGGDYSQQTGPTDYDELMPEPYLPTVYLPGVPDEPIITPEPPKASKPPEDAQAPVVFDYKQLDIPALVALQRDADNLTELGAMDVALIDALKQLDVDVVKQLNDIDFDKLRILLDKDN